MDIRSFCDAASWHPLTSIIEYEGAWADRHFIGLPFISQPSRVKGRSVVTTIHHELTHLASARTTRLGIALGVEAARLMAAYRAGGDLSLSVQACTLLGAYLPILEGLAIYAELDTEESTEDLLIPNPIPLHAQMMTLTWNAYEGRILQIAREEQIVENGINGPGLLRLLFADPNTPEANHYFVGYLWIKAASSLLAQIDPRFSRSTVMLPFLLRLLCDHPVIAKSWNGKANHIEITATLLRSIQELNQNSLSRVYNALARPDLLARFENWDLHGFLGDSSMHAPQMHSDKVLYPFFQGRVPTELENQTRLSASVHLPSRTTGKLLKASANHIDFNFEILTDEGETVSGNIMSITYLWRGLSFNRLCAKHIDAARRNEGMVLQQMSNLVGERVTIANYWALTAPTVFGVAIWAAGRDTMQLPMEPDWFERAEFAQITQLGLGLSIEERLSFAAALPPPTDVTIIARATNEILLSHLVSDALARSKMLRKRFSGMLITDTERQALEDWVACPLFRQEGWRLRDPAAMRLQAAFDMPGFGASLGLADLLPQIGSSP